MTTMSPLYQDDTRKYYKSVELIPRRDAFATGQNKDETTWAVKVGDFACMQLQQQEDGNINNVDQRLTPFTMAWQPIQILSIYRDRIASKLSTSKSSKRKKRLGSTVNVEIRYFYRLTDLDSRNQRYYCSNCCNNDHGKTAGGEEVLESDRVEVIDASFLLGRLVLLHSDSSSNNNSISLAVGEAALHNDNYDDVVPTVTLNYNNRFYLHQEKDVLQFNPVDDSISNNLMIRGVKSSHIMANDEQVKIETCNYLNLNHMVANDNDNDEDDGDDEMQQVVILPPPALTIHQHKDVISSPPSRSPNNNKQLSKENSITTHYYSSCYIQFPASTTTHPYETPPINWHVCVGDVVAVNCEDGIAPIGVDKIDRGGEKVGKEKNKEWYPYRVPWAHAQITAIYRHVDDSAATTNEDDDGTNPSTSPKTTTTLSAKEVLYDLRWFPRISEALQECREEHHPLKFKRLQEITKDETRTCEEILEGNHEEVGFQCLTLLGPIKIDSNRKANTNFLSSTQFVTQNRRTINSTIYCDKLNQPRLSPQKRASSSDSASNDLVVRAIEASRLWVLHKSKRGVYHESVMLSRKERDGVTKDDDDDEMFVSASTNSKESPAQNHRRGQIFHESPCTTTFIPKRRRSKRGNESVTKTPYLKTESEQPKTKKWKQLISPQNEKNSKQQQGSFYTQNEIEDDIMIPRVKCTKHPFHVDVSSQKSFYDEIDIQPPLDSYDNRFSTDRNDGEQQLWKVRLGDMVCIEVEQQQNQKADAVYFPFVVTWSPAEIVSIYRVHRSKAECLELRERLRGGNQHLNESINDAINVMVEVRWFYRKHEIPGAGKVSKCQHPGDLEEIFETDQIDTCSAECLLSPVKIYEVSRPEESLPSVISGMPCIHYHCRRYWSIHRKSFVPSGLLSNRIERGRMHSQYKTALGKLQSASSSNGKKSSEGYSWKGGFQSAIQKLSLAEAAADIQVHGMELKCRERERQHIGSFLRKAIRGLEQPANNMEDDNSVTRDDEGPMNTKSSMFICGPPGTGKTASVRSIVNELQNEQASGSLPEFNFIALNGMEMRSPFDSYVKFWEALSGTRKERLSAGAAAAKLEEYFGQVEEDESREDRSKKPIIVLMLDEIDYLVTKKQTILYNFFDWPLRATNARLIVIGISNTINLPERLSMKLQSRLGGERCHFKSYTVDETIAILKMRLDGDASQVFDEDAIKFASRKTGNLSGDIRKAFQMCKVAAQIALDDYTSGRRPVVEGTHPKVKISDVQRGSRDMYTSIIQKAISCSSSYEALVLIAIGALKKAKVGKDIVSLSVQEMLTKIESIANGSGEERYLSARLSLGDLLRVLSRLGDVSIVPSDAIKEKMHDILALSLLTAHHLKYSFDFSYFRKAGIITLTTPKNSNHPWPRIQTSLEPYELNSSFRNTPHSKLAEKHLAEQRLF